MDSSADVVISEKERVRHFIFDIFLGVYMCLSFKSLSLARNQGTLTLALILATPLSLL